MNAKRDNIKGAEEKINRATPPFSLDYYYHLIDKKVKSEEEKKTLSPCKRGVCESIYAERGRESESEREDRKSVV